MRNSVHLSELGEGNRRQRDPRDDRAMPEIYQIAMMRAIIARFELQRVITPCTIATICGRHSNPNTGTASKSVQRLIQRMIDAGYLVEVPCNSAVWGSMKRYQQGAIDLEYFKQTNAEALANYDASRNRFKLFQYS